MFHWVSYFLFIYDAISGVLTAILRIFLTQLFSLLLMVRLDRVVLMKGFECCDIGKRLYVRTQRYRDEVKDKGLGVSLVQPFGVP